MSQFTGIQIDIGGKSIRQFSSLTLSQSIFAHHSFRLVCPTAAIDGESGTILNASKNLIGGNFKLQIDSIGNSGTLKFAGVVTQVEAARYSGHSGDIIVSGYSPTILMDSGPHCKSWESKAVKNIAQDVVKHFTHNLLKPKFAPTHSDALSYMVQYKESAWQFLHRLSSTYGEWLYYDGQNLVMGPPKGGKANLVYGSNLPRFNMALQLRPSSFQMMAYDYINSEVYDGSPKSIAGKAGLNDLGKHALQKSEQFYASQPKQWHNHFLTNKKQLDDFVDTRAAMQSSNLVHFHGSSGHPGVQVGGSISVQGKNHFSQADESFGEYTVISVNHNCDGQGNYSNEFVAVPASVKFPPVARYADPHCETQSAFVTDNHDSKGLGRLRVKFHWMNGNEKSPWLRVTTPHAGEGKGMFIMPEIGEEVIVGFEGDNATKPYIIGAVYHGKAKCSFSNGGNDVKAIQSKSGNKVELNDKDGSVKVADSKDNHVSFDGKGNVLISSKESITLKCGAHFISIDKAGTIKIKGVDISVNGTTVSVDGKTITSIATEKAAMASGSAQFTADGKKNEANMGGQKANVNGSMETNVNSGMKTTVSATGKVAIQGAIVALN